MAKPVCQTCGGEMTLEQQADRYTCTPCAERRAIGRKKKVYRDAGLPQYTPFEKTKAAVRNLLPSLFD